MTIEQARGKIEIGTPVSVRTRVPVGAQACITPEDKGRVLRLETLKRGDCGALVEVEFQTPRKENGYLECGLKPGVYMLFVSNLETPAAGGVR